MSTQTPHERIRASIALTVAGEMADRLLQYDKANPSYKLRDLRDEDERAIYIAEIMDLMTPFRARNRAVKLNQLRSHGQALQDVRSDITRFGTMRPGWCHICRERVITNKVTLMITENLHAEAHGLCCSKDEDRYELIADFAYRIRPEAR